MGSNMDKIYIVMNYVEHDLKSLMETMKQPFLPGTFVLFAFPEILRAGEVANTNVTNGPAGSRELALGSAMCCFGMSCVPWI